MLQRHTLSVLEASIHQATVDDRLGEALSEWQKTAAGPIAVSALELRVGEHRLLHSISL